MREIQVLVKEERIIKKQGDLFGIFFEDLNHAADGGLYGELLQNRAFEFDRIDNTSYHSMTAWEEVERGNSMLQAHVNCWDPRTRQNPHYLVMEVLTSGEGAGVRNLGFNTGIPIKQREAYDFSCWYRVRHGKGNCFEVRLEDETGAICYATETLTGQVGEWSHISCTLQAGGTDQAARLAIVAKEPIILELDMVSLFPQKTWRMRNNGLRPDLAEMLADLKPKFVRFPGGCLTHIGSLDPNDRNALYRWKNTVGPVENRASKRNTWNYNQTFGLGFYEFFLFCEDIGASPLPVISAGYDPHYLRAADEEKMQEWIEDALDLIEFANGDVDTTWGKVRADMGHPESFHLKYLAVGNEEVGEEFYGRYEQICSAVNEKYPEILLINSAGPGSAGSEFVKGWEQAKRTGTAFVDEHFYQCPEWFVANAHRYEQYDDCDGEPKAFLGEYASHDTTWKNALAEAAFMIGMEKAKGMGLACYAPLLNNVDYTNWATNLVNFDNYRVYGTPSYYVQKLFMNYMGEELVESVCQGIIPQKKEPPVLHGRCRMRTDQSNVDIKDLVIKNEDTGEEIVYDSFTLAADQKEKELADIDWDHYTITFRYRRNAGGTSKTLTGALAFRLDFAMQDEENHLNLVLDGWQRLVSLGGVVKGKTCDMGLYHAIIDAEEEVPCKLQVCKNQIWARVGEVEMMHTCLSTQPDELYYSAVRDEEQNLIVKLVNLTHEEEQIQIHTEEEYAAGEIRVIEDCNPEWRNSFEEPQKVSPKRENREIQGRLSTYHLKPQSFMVVKLKRRTS